MKKLKTGILLVNLGTPDSPSVGDVRKYLAEFLNDNRVIDIAWLPRKLLVNGVIVPFRAPKSSKVYKELWDMYDGVSPLLKYGVELKEKLQHKLGGDFVVDFGMRYQKPSMKIVLDNMLKQNIDELIVFPLYPHYASSSTGSTIEAVMKHLGTKWTIPHVKIVNSFFDHEAYINSVVETTKQFRLSDYDKIVFSYHGLPVRQVTKVNELCSNSCNCSLAKTTNCYKYHCTKTTELVAEKLGLDKSQYQIMFQSRLGREEWLLPFSEDVIKNLAKEGKKKLLVLSPSFVADCLETSIEIGEEYNELFQEHGGEKITLVPSLNSNDFWVDAITQILKDKTGI